MWISNFEVAMGPRAALEKRPMHQSTRYAGSACTVRRPTVSCLEVSATSAATRGDQGRQLHGTTVLGRRQFLPKVQIKAQAKAMALARPSTLLARLGLLVAILCLTVWSEICRLQRLLGGMTASARCRRRSCNTRKPSCSRKLPASRLPCKSYSFRARSERSRSTSNLTVQSWAALTDRLSSCRSKGFEYRIASTPALRSWVSSTPNSVVSGWQPQSRRRSSPANASKRSCSSTLRQPQRHQGYSRLWRASCLHWWACSR